MFGKSKTQSKLCHHTGFKQTCESLRDQCPKWVQIVGNDPVNGERRGEYRCVDAWLPVLLIEGNQQQRQTAKAVQSFRSELADGQADLANVLRDLSEAVRLTTEETTLDLHGLPAHAPATLVPAAKKRA